MHQDSPRAGRPARRRRSRARRIARQRGQIQTGPTNKVPLVALKDTVVRVSPVVVRGVLGADPLSGVRVTGELVVTRGNRIVYRTGPTRADGVRVGRRRQLDAALWDQELIVPDGPVGPGPAAVSTSLLQVNCPLNFMVPAYFCRPGMSMAPPR
ncbi:MAG TPA: hypothetical protein VMT69_06275 [Kineosporiaceae bacterium]|nr:hypothetical protein [Kineosporiaceae bacterium]